jgi:hypothetical protein
LALRAGLIVISRSTGDEIWRDDECNAMGKDLYVRLHDSAKSKYGDKLDAF